MNSITKRTRYIQNIGSGQCKWSLTLCFSGCAEGLDDGVDAAHVSRRDRSLLSGQHHALFHQHDQVTVGVGQVQVQFIMQPNLSRSDRGPARVLSEKIRMSVLCCSERLGGSLRWMMSHRIWCRITLSVLCCSERIGWIPEADDVPQSLVQDYRWIFGLSVTEMEIVHGAYRKDNPNCTYITGRLSKL